MVSTVPQSINGGLNTKTNRYTLIMYVSLAQIQVETGNETCGRAILKA